MIAALYVETNGVYFGLPDVDPWDEARDARKYQGPDPVVAHPECQRWGRYWSGGPNPRAQRRTKGDDGGQFAHAMWAVQTFGGVLEHPEASHAFAFHGIGRPLRGAGWLELFGKVNGFRRWVCCVEQGHYGHPARKATWLFACVPSHVDLPELIWTPSRGARLDEGFHSKAEREAARASGQLPRQRLSTKENLRTPVAFRDDVMLAIARSVRRARQAA